MVLPVTLQPLAVSHAGCENYLGIQQIRKCIHTVADASFGGLVVGYCVVIGLCQFELGLHFVRPGVTCQSVEISQRNSLFVTRARENTNLQNPDEVLSERGPDTPVLPTTTIPPKTTPAADQEKHNDNQNG
jgi:hypothetical protein